jgi:type III restriction enzyme
VAIDSDGINWVIEVKSDKDMSSADVQGKREAAKR